MVWCADCSVKLQPCTSSQFSGIIIMYVSCILILVIYFIISDFCIYPLQQCLVTFRRLLVNPIPEVAELVLWFWLGGCGNLNDYTMLWHHASADRFICCPFESVFTVTCCPKLIFSSAKNFPRCNLHIHQLRMFLNLCHGQLSKWVHCNLVQHDHHWVLNQTTAALLQQNLGHLSTSFMKVYLHLPSEKVIHTQSY
jgi:hypothetical protein